MKLNRAQREFMADKLMDTANYAIAALVFGQFLSDKIELLILLLGLLVYAWLGTISLQLKRGGKK